MKSFNNFKIYNEEQNRVIDSNGFLYVKKSPILKSGILDYYGEELEKDVVDGVKIQPDKIYKVYIHKDELKKSLNSFKLKPIVEDHEWLGKDGSNAKGKQEGTTGENAYIDGEYLMIDLQFNNLDTIEKIQNNEKRELSASYQNNLIKAPAGADYDFVATDIQPNHIALVERGRCGSDVRVYNNLLTTNKKKMIKLVIDGKELDLEKFIGEEQQEGEHDESIQDVENEDIEDTEIDVENEQAVDKRKLIDEVGGILKGKVDDEIIRTVLKKMEEASYNGSETDKADNACQSKNEDKEEDEEKKNIKENIKSMNYDAIYTKIYNSVKESIAKEQQEKVKAYNSAKNLCGDFDYTNMTELEILNKGLAGVGLQAENIDEAKAMVKVYNSTSNIDNSFVYDCGGAKDTFELNF